MPRGGPRRGSGRPRHLTAADLQQIAHDYVALVEWRKLRGLPGPHRDIAINAIVESWKYRDGGRGRTAELPPKEWVSRRMVVSALDSVDLKALRRANDALRGWRKNIQKSKRGTR